MRTLFACVLDHFVSVTSLKSFYLILMALRKNGLTFYGDPRRGFETGWGALLTEKKSARHLIVSVCCKRLKYQNMTDVIILTFKH